MKYKYTLIDKQNRSVLGEGRSVGLGYGFCHREGDTFTTAMPITACKDYLNDQVYSEVTGKLARNHGFSSVRQDIFKDGWGYQAMSVLPQLGSKSAPSETHVKLLEGNYLKMQDCLNWFEQSCKSEQFTVIEKVGDNMFVVLTPIMWCGGTAMISLNGFMLRVSMYGFDKKDPEKSFKASAKKCEGCDYYMGNIWPKMERIMKDGPPKQDMTHCSPHNLGINGYYW